MDDTSKNRKHRFGWSREKLQEQQQSYGEHLPRLVDLLSGLTKNIAHETNQTSIDFMRYLHDIEDKMITKRQRAEKAVAHLGDLDLVAKDHRVDQLKLEQDLTEALRVGTMIREEIVASRTAMELIAASINSMREEIRSVEAFSREIKIIAINATIASARVGEQGREFAVISGEVRRLAQDTAAIIERIGPLFDQVLTDLSQYTHASPKERTDRKDNDVVKHLDKQAGTLGALKAKIGEVTTNFEQLIELNSVQQEEKKATANNIEGSIRGALSCAQSGDVIRQQAETIDEMLQSLNRFFRDQDLNSDIRAGVDQLIDELSRKYVMYSQRRVHTEAGHQANDTWSTSDEDLKIELF